jgi:predicted O-methyltransferase YrrM
MAARSRLGRREFLQIAAGGANILAATAPAQAAAAGEAQASRPVRTRDEAQLRKLLGEMEARGPQFWSVPRRDGELLRFLVKITRVKHVLEVGTSHGYSAIWMGLGLEETDGRLITIELDAARHDLARRHVSEAGLSRRITLLRGDAHVEVTKLDGPFDFVFLDADKEGQVDYFNKLYPKRLSPGGVLAVHNAIQQAGAMRDYLDMVRKHPDFDTVTVSATMSDGFCLSYRRRTA